MDSRGHTVSIAGANAPGHGGFTLLEVVIAIAILVVIMAIVYASFSSVTHTVEAARVSTEEMRLRQFLERSFRTNLAAVYVDRSVEQEVFNFVGIDDESKDGPNDSLRFVSINALMGGAGLPGDFKEVRYETIGGDESDLDAALRDDVEEALERGEDLRQRKLQATETPVLASNVEELDSETGYLAPNQGKNGDEAVYESPTWTVPIRTIDFSYYDGTEWVNEWDAQVLGLLPWCVRIRINFARTEEQLEQEREERFDVNDDPDFELVVPLAIGIGRKTDGRTQEQLEEAADQAQEDAESGGEEGERVGGEEAAGAQSETVSSILSGARTRSLR
jgi:prepilin-type N-terminal cleavage/methylation domain-containing protein